MDDKKDGEIGNVYINEISCSKAAITPKTGEKIDYTDLMALAKGESTKFDFEPQPNCQQQWSKNYKFGTSFYSFVVFVDAVSPHAIGVWAGYVQEIMLRDFLGGISGTKKVQYKLVHDPLPMGKDIAALFDSIQGFFIGFALSIVYIIVAPSLVRAVVEEREKGQKNQMIVSGVKLPAFWVGHYVKDVIFGLVLFIYMVIMMAIFDVQMEGAWLLILLAAFAIPPFLYFFGNMFDKAENSSGLVLFYMFLLNFLAPIVVFVLQIIESTQDIGKALKWILSLICP